AAVVWPLKVSVNVPPVVTGLKVRDWTALPGKADVKAPAPLRVRVPELTVTGPLMALAAVNTRLPVPAWVRPTAAGPKLKPLTFMRALAPPVAPVKPTKTGRAPNRAWRLIW